MISSRSVNLIRNLAAKPVPRLHQIQIDPAVCNSESFLRLLVTLKSSNPALIAGVKMLSTTHQTFPSFMADNKENQESPNDQNEEIDYEERQDSSRNAVQPKERDPKDRSRVIPVDISIKYLNSEAYQETYGNSKVWELYRRNFAKGRTYRPTRPNCIREGRLITNNPCPICRDEYLVVDYRNIKLLSQFITDYNGEVLTSKRTGVCQHQWMKILVELEKAKDHGLLNIDPPFVEYDYSMYMPQELKKAMNKK